MHETTPGPRRKFNLQLLSGIACLLPLALFLIQGSSSKDSMLAAVAAVLSAWHVTRATRAAPSSTEAAFSWEIFRTFAAVDSLPFVPSLAAVCCALCAHGGAIAAVLGRPSVMSAFMAAGAAVAAWSSNRYTLTDEPDESAVDSAVVTAGCAAVLMLIGLLPVLHGGSDDTAAASGPAAAATSDNAATSEEALGGIYRGVILLPEPSPHTVLVPPLPSLRRDLFSKPDSHPLSVPFFGVYWIFRFPNRQPPPRSYRIRGSPLTSAFRSSDRFPLTMEAHQNFGRLIDLNCCRQIQLAIHDADDSFVALELIVRNTTLPGIPSLSLGRLGAAPAAGAVPAAETLLSYNVPQRDRKLREFDEATIVYRRGFPTSSARLAIDRFIFVPRGF